MIKTTREDYLDLNTDGNLDLNKVNDFLEKLQQDYDKDENNDEEIEEDE